MTAIPKSELMKRLRAERKAAGLVEVRLWVDPADVEAIKAFADLYREAESVVDDSDETPGVTWSDKPEYKWKGTIG